MKKEVLLAIVLLFIQTAFAQKNAESRILTDEERQEIIDIHVMEDYKIYMPVYRVYEIKYQGTKEYLVLCESRDSVNGTDTLNKNIKAILFAKGGAGLEKEWEINDNIVSSAAEETTISFWTRYLNFEDYDQDGFIDYTLIYGTKAMNGHGDGRIKFLLVNKAGEKLFIRHQNGILDDERETKIDKAFYTLPRTWQMAVQKRMQLLEKEEKAIFPAGWLIAMKNHKTIINERK